MQWQSAVTLKTFEENISQSFPAQTKFSYYLPKIDKKVLKQD